MNGKIRKYGKNIRKKCIRNRKRQVKRDHIRLVDYNIEMKKEARETKKKTNLEDEENKRSKKKIDEEGEC